MLHSYLKVIFRNFFADGLYSAIIVFGLAVGISVTLIIAQYMYFEFSFDKQYKDADRIWYTYMSWTQGSRISDFECHPAVAPVIRKSVTGVDDVVRIAPAGIDMGDEWLLKREKDGNTIDFGRINHMLMADADVFEFFAIPFLEGDQKTALSHGRSIVLTRSIADKFFPNESPLDKTLKVLTFEFIVTGVIPDPSPNSSIQYALFFSLDLFADANLDGTWELPRFKTFIKLHPGADPQTVERNINEAAATQLTALQKAYSITEVIKLYPFQDFHFYKPYDNRGGSPVVFTGDKRIIGFFSAIAILILIICWANYINLTIARALGRAKEVGLRKVSGAARSNLIVQFLSEFFLLNLLSLLVAFTLTQWLFSTFASAIGSEAEWMMWKDPLFWLAVTAFLIISTLVSGIYPAFVMSNYNPVTVLKGNFGRSESGAKLRKALVVIQFGLSAFLLMSIYVITRQLHFMQTKDLGLSADQVLIVRLEEMDTTFNRRVALDRWKAKLQNRSDIKMQAAVSNYPGDPMPRQQVYHPVEDPQNTSFLEANIVTSDYFETMGIKLLYGRTFRNNELTDSSAVIINETAAHQLGYENPESALNRHVVFTPEKRTLEIIGVVKDFSASVKDPAYGLAYQPKLFFYDYAYFVIKVSTDNILSTVSQLEREWKDQFNIPFDHFFLDAYYDTFYRQEKQFAGVFGFFSVIGMLVTCLGLFGLSMYNTSSRAKEIGIRKSLGASSAGIVWLFSKEYLRLVLAAGVVCIPIGAWLLNSWLKNYPNRIEFGLDFIVVPLVLMIFIAQLTVGYQTYKAAHANPVNSLRNN